MPGTQHLTEDKAKSLLRERDAKIAALEKEVSQLSNQLSTLNQAAAAQARNHPIKRRHHPLTPYGNMVQEAESKCGEKRRQLINERARMGRNASIATAAALNALPDDKPQNPLAQRIVDMFKDPASHLTYLNSEQFARDLLKLNHKVRPILEEEPRVAFLQSPAYVFGDIHGNLEDLHFFSDNVWRLGMDLTAGNFVFLGDYVDRGMSCLECVAYLLAMKLLLPHKVFLLRGNHETRDVNGWEEHYGERSFIYQCRERFGDDLGFRVWEQTNQVFDRLPLAAVIDQDIFCVHGGIPRPVSAIKNGGSRIQDILSVPKVAGINPPYEHEDEMYQQVASDCIWSDPASEVQEATGVDPTTGFGESLRGGGAICFGHTAVTNFLQQQGFSYIMRAHEAHAEGVAVSKGARVFTVFSTSKDHNQGSKAMAGCILVDFEKMQVINRSPAYRNQYVHRRDSVSIAMLSDQEIKQRMKLGLIEADPNQHENEEWEDLVEDEEESSSEEDDDNDDDDDEEDSEDENYVIDSRRKSSVDPIHTIASPPGSSHDNHHVVWTDGVSSETVRKFDFSNVEMSNRKKGRDLRRFSAINEEVEDEEEEDSTVNGDDDDDDEPMENVDPMNKISFTNHHATKRTHRPNYSSKASF
jgi:diadenosine tetraphosphatase ApaH/serine/threonine PP2A family protein phosphatase